MADQKITDLSDGGALQSGDYTVVARSGSNYKVQGSNVGILNPSGTAGSGVMATDGGGWLRKTWAQLKAKLGLALNAYDYGVTFDGTTNDLAAWQAAFNAVVSNNGGQINGIPPSGTVGTPPADYATSLISATTTVTGVNSGSTLNVASTASFPSTNGCFMLAGTVVTYTGTTATSFTGCSTYTATSGGETVAGVIGVPWGTFWSFYAPGLVLKQANDNTPIIVVTNTGIGAGRQSAGWKIEGPLWFTWTNAQKTTVATQGVLSGTGTGTFTVTSATVFANPIPGTTSLTILIDKEQITGTLSSTTFTITARGANGSTAVSHTAGTAVYPTGGTQACAVWLATDTAKPNYSNFVLEKVGMGNGNYLLGESSTTNEAAGWGYKVKDVYMDQTVTGGVINNAQQWEGQPNIQLENHYVVANNMVGPLYNLNIQSGWITGIEINNSWLSPVIIKNLSGSSLAIGALKSEFGTYDNRNGGSAATSGAMFSLGSCVLEAQYIRLQGMNVDTTGMNAPCIFTRGGSSGGQPQHVGTLDFVGDYKSTSTSTNGWQITAPVNSYFISDSTPTTGPFTIDNIYGQPARNFYPSRSDAAVYQDGFYIEQANRGRVSADKGDANYTWDPLGVPATAVLTCTGTKPSDGDTITIGTAQGVSVTYTFRNTLVAIGDVKISASAGAAGSDATLDSLIAACNGTGTPGTDYYTGTFSLVMSKAGTRSASGACTITFTAIPGQIGNSFTSTETSAQLSFGGSTFSGGLPPENIINFDTALTGNRTVTLPSKASATQSNMFNGAWVQINRTGGGAFSLSVVEGANTLATIASGQTGSVRFAFRRGTWVQTATNNLPLSGGTMNGIIAMGSNKITGLAAGGSAADAVRYDQVLLLNGGTMAGAIAMGANYITGLADPVNPQDAATRNYIDGSLSNMYATGILVPFAGASSANTAMSASTARLVRFVAPQNIAITKIAFYLGTAAGSNDNVDVGIYNSTLSTLIASSGSTAGKLNAAAPSVQTVTLGATANLTRGTVYYAAIAFGTFGSGACSIHMGSYAPASLMGASAPNIYNAVVTSSAFPLAAAPTLGAATSGLPILALLT